MKKYCPDVEHGLYVRRISATSAQVGFCCQSGMPGLVDKIDFNHNETLNLQREKFKQDPASVTACSSCWRVEDSGGHSRRHGIIQWYEHRGQIGENVTGLISLDYNTENVCNLQCLTCGPRFSSSWRQLAKKLSLPDDSVSPTASKNTQAILDLDLTNVRRVYFNGGEPFLTDDHEFILSKLRENNQLDKVDVSYNTNGTVVPSDSIFDFWEEARLVKIMLSVDATGAAYEFIRHPASWEQLIKTVEIISSRNPHVMFDLTFTLGLHNICYLDDTIAWFEKDLHNPLGDVKSFNLQLVGPISHGGKVLSLSNLPESIKPRILESLTLARNYEFWGLIEKSLTLPPTGKIDDAIAYLNDISAYRATHWNLALSRLYNIINFG